MNQLKKLLARIDGNSYKAYKDIKGSYRFDDYQLRIDHVQGDPFAAPSRISLVIPMAIAGFPGDCWQKGQNHSRKIALEDYLSRRLANAIDKHVKGHRGSGCSGLIAIDTNGQQILQRNCVLLSPEAVEIRLVMGLPANGRRANGREASIMFFEELPKVVAAGCYFKNLNEAEMLHHLASNEDQDTLRNWLTEQGYVAFIADNALLPRKSGISDLPLQEQAVRFKSPETLSQQVSLPNTGTITGMAIPQGVTLIVGGGFHGKSTLLHAIERGPYNHIPGDGREQVVALPSAMKVRAEDGRHIAKVNISPFIDRLPFGKNTREFSTENASGSTSQAANIIEALETGTRLLLIDEDTSATNFMIRDERMQALVARDKEPITPLVARIRELYENHGISSIIVMGGSGDYFDIADTVIMLDNYEPLDVSTKAKALARPIDATSQSPSSPPFFDNPKRLPGRKTLDASRGKREVKIDVKETRVLNYGEYRIDLNLVEQLIDSGQTRSIGLMIHHYAQHYAPKSDTLIEGLQQLLHNVQHQGLDSISPYRVGNLAMPRLQELAAAINRIRNKEWK